MRPSQLVRRATDYLARHDVDSPRPTAEQLLESVLGTDRAGLYARVAPLRADESAAFGRALCRRCSGEPTQHVTGVAGFRRLTLQVRPGVFVPRPETEVVVDAALGVVRDRRSPTIVDIGTGTGAIALAMKHERPDARVWAVDRSEDAVELARDNARRLGLGVRVVLGDLLAGFEAGSTACFDVVVSNPPYIDVEEHATLPREVRADPSQALLGGLAVYRALFAQASALLCAGGAVVVEIDERRASDVAGAALEAGAGGTRLLTDLAGRDRVVVATWP